MAEADGYGLAITTASAKAAQHYRRGLELTFLGQPDADAAFDAAVAEDPSLAVAHASRARIHQMQGEREASNAAVARARAVAAGASEREKSHVEVISLGVEGRAPQSLAMALEHLKAWPRDAVVMSLPLGPFGLYAFSGMAGHDKARLELCELHRESHIGDWWFQTMYGFALAENGRIAEGRRLIEQAFAARPDNANAAHDLAHAMHEAGEAREADAMIEAWLPTYDPRGILHAHIAWHQALTALDQGDLDRAVALYETHVRPESSQALDINVVSDAASFLWRLSLQGYAPPERAWPEASAFAGRVYPNPGFAFVDVHMAMVAAANLDTAALERRTTFLDAKVESGQYRAGPIGPAVTRALFAFAEGRYAACVAHLEPVAHEIDRIGGSRAQREVLEETLLVALIRSGQAGKARTLLDARLGRRPTGRDTRWRAELQAA